MPRSRQYSATNTFDSALAVLFKDKLPLDNYSSATLPLLFPILGAICMHSQCQANTHLPNKCAGQQQVCIKLQIHSCQPGPHPAFAV
mmetsp:Transcript_42463/g.76129  ORF Transcript_42463/g.76129 Transcript_42463/m.76129 type:complete len:87 (-) Transcript_42463:55-315(-)